MGGFGAISGMISSVKNNLNLKSTRKTARDRNGEYQARMGKPLRFEGKMTDEEHALHRAKLKAGRLKSNIILGTTLLFMVLVVLLVFSLI